MATHAPTGDESRALTMAGVCDKMGVMADTKRIRVILADDHAVVRKGTREFLEAEPDISVVAEAADGLQAMALVAEHRPDVALLDVQMPGLNGIEATRRIRAEFPQVRVLILTAYDDEPYVRALLREGAGGFVLKTADSGRLVEAVRAVSRGEPTLDGSIMRKVMRQLASDRPHDTPPTLEAPTERELEVLRLAAKGLTNKAIGQALSISDRTVQGHLANIYGKLGVGSRTEAVTEALKLGWIAIE